MLAGLAYLVLAVSIHAPREGSDRVDVLVIERTSRFNPRSP